MRRNPFVPRLHVTPEPVPEEAVHSPQGALWRAAAVPGWGQIYNGQYYKLPFVYGGLGAIVISALYNNHQYLRYRHAYLYAVAPEAYPQYADDAAEFQQFIQAGQATLLRSQRDVFRRNRDLSYIGIGLFYGLTILDAYVSAHLLEFDIDEDLSLHVVPTVYPAGIHVRLSARPRRFR